MTATTAIATTPPPEGCIDTQVLDHVLLIGINRPAKRNGWTPRMFRELGEAYTRLDDDPALRVGVLHAFGDHFTAGLDLPAVAEYMKRGEKAIPVGLVDPFDLGTADYRRRTKPMLLAVKGICFTVGIELMLGADIVIAADDCRFSQMEVQRGIMATGGATLRMAERAGLGNAMLHLLTADEFDSAEALRLNFVQKVVPAGQELDEALRIAQRIAAQAPLAVVATRLNVVKAIEQGPLAAVEDFIPHPASFSETLVYQFTLHAIQLPSTLRPMPSTPSAADMLRLDNQLCFAVYSASLAMTKLYKPLLDKLKLTYPQYLVMLVLWERDGLMVSELGERLSLDSGTLTPLLKRLEANGLVARIRDVADERRVHVSLTAAGRRLKVRAASVPACLMAASQCSVDELVALTQQIQQLRDRVKAAA